MIEGKGGGGSWIRDKRVGEGRVEGGTMGKVVKVRGGSQTGDLGERGGSPGGLMG
jgi:hypothetical protein